VHKIESNPVRQIDPIIIIDAYENPLQTKCIFCEPNLCKGSIINQYRNGNLYGKIIFIGDGDNDVCAALQLDKTDYVFAKYDDASKKVFKMYDMLKNQYFQQLKAELLTWTTMKDVHEILKKKNIL
jgi:pyridoxal phosphate phosphatase PHOSPHO2